MQALGPYRLLRPLGTCAIGGVWAGVDPAGNEVSVAVLHPAVAQDPRWREAFSAAGHALARSTGHDAVGADLNSAAPWIAYPAGSGFGADQLFVSLGQQYQPVADEPEPGSADGTPATAEATTHLFEVHGDSVAESTAALGVGTALRPSSAVLSQISAVPAQFAAAAGPAPAALRPVSPAVEPPTETERPGSRRAEAASSSAGVTPHRRLGAWIGLLALIILLPGLGSGIIAATMRSQSAHRHPVPAVSESAPSEAPFVTPAPSQPGLEPPRAGGWPESWPTFDSQDQTRSVRPAGLGFSFHLPDSLRCTQIDHSTGFARYSCAESGAGPNSVSADLLTRDCPSPCDGTRRVQLRRAEEAWGLQWIRATSLLSWAETDQVNGSAEYGVVMVAFWRTKLEGPLNRETVLRVTGPLDRTDEIRKLVNSIREAID